MTTGESDAGLTPAEALARWSLDELDAWHALVGLGPEWIASDRRAELATYSATHPIPPAEKGQADG